MKVHEEVTSDVGISFQSASTFFFHSWFIKSEGRGHMQREVAG